VTARSRRSLHEAEQHERVRDAIREHSFASFHDRVSGVQVGSAERLFDEGVELARRAEHAGVIEAVCLARAE
jgi:hypothetical protein